MRTTAGDEEPWILDASGTIHRTEYRQVLKAGGGEMTLDSILAHHWVIDNAM
jgi:hypothetical protein